MSTEQELPLQSWAEQVSAARRAKSISQTELAHQLMLSPAQMRCIEAASLTAFHGVGYYLRALKKCETHLGISLAPPLQSLDLTDSQLALKRFKKPAPATTLAKRQSHLHTADQLPTGHRRTKVGAALIGLLVLLVGTGVWLALDEGWPGLSEPPPDVANLPAQTVSGAADVRKNEAGATTERASTTLSSTASGPADSSLPQSALALPATPNEPAKVGQPTTATDTESNRALAADSQPPTADAAKPMTAQTTASASPDVIEASFRDDCWVEIRYRDGRIKQAIYKPGQSLSFMAQEATRLTFGNAQAVKATRQGQPFDVMTYTKGGNNVARIPESALQ